MKAKVPEMRFEGFDGDWEQWRLGDVLKIRNEVVNPDNYDFDVELENIVSDMGTLIGDTSVRTQTKSLFRKGDTLFGRLRPYLNKWWLADRDGLKSGEIWALIPSGSFDEAFAYMVVQSEPFLSHANISSGTKMPRSDWSKVSEALILAPSLTEQTAIGNFFRNLDDAISLAKQQHEKTVSIKKAMLQKMFPKKGAVVPEIRFEGFSGEWEQKSLNDVADIIGGGTPSTSIPAYWGGNIDWYSPVEIGEQVYADGSQRKITAIGLSKCSATILPAYRTILFTSRAGIGDMAILRKEAATNQGFQSLIMKDGYDAYFTYSMGHLIKNYALRTASGSTFLEISGKLLGMMSVLYPPSPAEQTAIGNFFRNLDTLIEAQCQEIEKLHNIKNACLNKMFV